MVNTDKDYPLLIEILVDRPCSAMLSEGQICAAKPNPRCKKDFLVRDDNDPREWKIYGHEAKVI